MNRMVLMTVTVPDRTPNLSDVSDLLGVPVCSIDIDFGVVLVDARKKTYAVRVEAEHAERSSKHHQLVSGPYSDPQIGLFGIPK